MRHVKVAAPFLILALCAACSSEPGPFDDLAGNWYATSDGTSSCQSAGGVQSYKQVITQGSIFYLVTSYYPTADCTGDASVEVETDFDINLGAGTTWKKGDTVRYPRAIQVTYYGATITPMTTAVAQTFATQPPCTSALPLTWTAKKAQDVSGLTCANYGGVQVSTATAAIDLAYSITNGGLTFTKVIAPLIPSATQQFLQF